MKRNERLLSAIGNIDEKYIKEAEGKMSKGAIIKAAVIFGVIIALGLYLFLPFAPVTSDLTAYRGSDYFPLIEGIEEYRLRFKQPKYNNNFEVMMDAIGSLGILMAPDMEGSVPDGGADMNGGAAPGDSGNGSYVESTDNQTEGVIESDLMKMTDRYIFRLGWRSDVNYRTNFLRVYSIDKENTALVAEYELPRFENEFFKDFHDGEMFLSADGLTVTIIKNYTDEKTNSSKVGITLIDVSDINNVTAKAMVSIDGSLNTCRMVDGRLLLVSEFYFNRSTVDYNDPATFVPSIDSGNGAEPIQFEDIIFPDKIGTTRYSVVSLLDGESLSLLGANALLGFTEEVYVSNNNVYVTRAYTKDVLMEDLEHSVTTNARFTDVAVLNYSGESLESKGVITVRGWAEDQYSFDEKDGYLRVVTSTREQMSVSSAEGHSFGVKENASLYIYNLSDNSLAYKLEDFAIEGEEATAVRFRGDIVYVCTAVKVTFTDPVYFIDLSDYENIKSADTGIIEGYSDHLIDLGEGFLLGIGREGWENCKVEVYEQQGDEVVGVDQFLFDGSYSLEYKAYLVNREKNLFGFGVDSFYLKKEDGSSDYGDRYVLLQFNGYEINALIVNLDGMNMQSDTVRAAYIDGYLYITTSERIKVVAVE